LTNRPRDWESNSRVATRTAIASVAGLVLWLAQPTAAEPGEQGEARETRQQTVAFSRMPVQDQVRTLLDNDYYEIHLDMRFRIEIAEDEGLEQSQAPTLRTRLGIETRPYQGFSAFAEMENNVSFCDSCYFDGTEPATGQTPIADTEFTELNRAFGKYENKGDHPLTAIVGRQRINLDDQRFIGAVGWRQNEQTFDSVYAHSTWGIEGLDTSYAYLWEIKRIFADKGPPEKRDFDSKSHIIHASYQFKKGPTLTFFTYLLDLRSASPSSALFSSNSYGFRAMGSHEISDNWKLDYLGSYAYQTQAGDNPVDYGAHYVWVSGLLRYEPVGRVGLGYELLGSDRTARFVTPLATLHKFNGFADVWLDNGGVGGLQDLFVTISPRIPWKLEGKLVYHHFWSAANGAGLGNEIDGVLSRPLGYGFSVLTKGAYYASSAASRSIGRRSIWRWTFDVMYEF